MRRRAATFDATGNSPTAPARKAPRRSDDGRATAAASADAPAAPAAASTSASAAASAPASAADAETLWSSSDSDSDNDVVFRRLRVRAATDVSESNVASPPRPTAQAAGGATIVIPAPRVALKSRPHLKMYVRDQINSDNGVKFLASKSKELDVTYKDAECGAELRFKRTSEDVNFELVNRSAAEKFIHMCRASSSSSSSSMHDEASDDDILAAPDHDAVASEDEGSDDEDDSDDDGSDMMASSASSASASGPRGHYNQSSPHLLLVDALQRSEIDVRRRSRSATWRALCSARLCRR